MTNTLHDETRREQSRDKQIKFRATERTVDAFDEWVAVSEYDSRSEALRAAMQRFRASSVNETPRIPPTDSELLRDAYIHLCEISNINGIVPHDIAATELSSELGISKDTVTYRVLDKLRDRGYLTSIASLYGSRSWHIAGWNHE